MNMIILNNICEYEYEYKYLPTIKPTKECIFMKTLAILLQSLQNIKKYSKYIKKWNYKIIYYKEQTNMLCLFKYII